MSILVAKAGLEIKFDQSSIQVFDVANRLMKQ